MGWTRLFFVGAQGGQIPPEDHVENTRERTHPANGCGGSVPVTPNPHPRGLAGEALGLQARTAMPVNAAANSCLCRRSRAGLSGELAIGGDARARIFDRPTRSGGPRSRRPDRLRSILPETLYCARTWRVIAMAVTITSLESNSGVKPYLIPGFTRRQSQITPGDRGGQNT